MLASLRCKVVRQAATVDQGATLGAELAQFIAELGLAILEPGDLRGVPSHREARVVRRLIDRLRED
jgi:hypothetical protein